MKNEWNSVNVKTWSFLNDKSDVITIVQTGGSDMYSIVSSGVNGVSNTLLTSSQIVAIYGLKWDVVDGFTA